MKTIFRLTLVLLLLWPTQALAEIAEQIKNDFSALHGMIIMPVGDEFLIDLDVSVSLKEGDILSLATTGQPIIHPETKEILGTLNNISGFMKVTQVKSGYSYAKTITAQRTPQKGDVIIRFEQVPALMDSSLEGSPLAAELESGFPQLKWLKADTAERPLLTFHLAEDRLSINDSEGMTIRSYSYVNSILSAPFNMTSQNANFSITDPAPKNRSLVNQTVDKLLGTINFGKKDKRLENPEITRRLQHQDGKIWISPNLDGNPTGLAVADFDGDGSKEIAIEMDDNLQIYRLRDNKLKKVSEFDFPNGVHLLKIDTLDLNKNGLPELYLSANAGKNLSSQIVEWKQGQYQRVQKQIPWLLRMAPYSQETPVLIAKKLSVKNNIFTANYFITAYNNDQLTRGNDLKLSPDINFFSFIPLTNGGNEQLYADLSDNDYLRIISPSGNTLWQSSEHYGGSEAFFYNTTDMQDDLIKPVFIQQRLIQLPSGEILVPQNDGQRVLERYRKFSKSRIVAMKFDGLALSESWQTTDQNGYLADFALADADNDGTDELVTVVKYSQKNLLQKGRSALVIYELK